MNIVLLDGASLPSPLARPLEATEWSEREKTPLDQLVEALSLIHI